MFALPRRLPQELMDMIIDLTTEAEWRQCSLVCRSWTRASQAHTFRCITVTTRKLRKSRKTNEYLPHRLHELLQMSPRLARHVRDITIVLEGLRIASLRTGQQLLAITLPKFHRLMRISVTCGYGVAFDFETSLLEALRATIASPQMKHVSLAGFCELEDLAPIISLMGTTLTSLTSLELTEITVCNPSTAVSPPKGDGPPVVLEFLVVAGSLPDLSGWFSMLRHPLVVKKLSLEGYEDASPLLAVLAPGLEELCLSPDEYDELPWADLSPLRQLNKLSLMFDDSTISSLKTIGKGSCLEWLELQIYHEEFDSPEFISSLQSLDELLSTTTFTSLRSIVFSFINHALLEVDDFKILKKHTRRVISRGILQLRFLETGEIVDSAQIRNQAALYEVCYPSDFPWFMDILEEVKEEDYEDDHDHDCTEGDRPYFGLYCPDPGLYVSMDSTIARPANPITSSLAYALSAPIVSETPAQPLPYTITTTTTIPQHLPQASSPPVQSPFAFDLTSLSQSLRLPPPDVSGNIFPLELLASVASSLDFPIATEHATPSPFTGGMADYAMSNATSYHHNGAEASNWAVQMGTHPRDTVPGLTHLYPSPQYHTYIDVGYASRVWLEGDCTSGPTASSSSHGYLPDPMYSASLRHGSGANDGAIDAPISPQFPDSSYNSPPTSSSPTPPQPYSTHIQEVIDASGMIQSNSQYYDSSLATWEYFDEDVPSDSPQSVSLYNPMSYYYDDTAGWPRQMSAQPNRDFENPRYPTSPYASDDSHHPSPEPYLEDAPYVKPFSAVDGHSPPIDIGTSTSDSSFLSKVYRATSVPTAASPYSSFQTDSPHPKSTPPVSLPHGNPNEFDPEDQSSISLASMIFPPGLIAEIASTLPDF